MSRHKPSYLHIYICICMCVCVCLFCMHPDRVQGVEFEEGSLNCLEAEQEQEAQRQLFETRTSWWASGLSISICQEDPAIESTIRTTQKLPRVPLCSWGPPLPFVETPQFRDVPPTTTALSPKHKCPHSRL